MKERDPQFVRDVEDLLEETVLQEAAQAVYEAFEKAMDSLDPESRALLQLHFNGKSSEEISHKLALSPEDVKTWLVKSKRSIIQNIGQQTKVRQ